MSIKGWDYHYTGNHKPQKIESLEEALYLVRERFGQDVYKQGSLVSWSFIKPGFEQPVAEYFMKTKYYYLRMLKQYPKY